MTFSYIFYQSRERLSILIRLENSCEQSFLKWIQSGAYLVWFLSWWDIHITDSAILQTGQYTQLAALCGNTHALYQKARLRWQNAAIEVFIVLAVFVCSWVLLLWFWEYNVVSRRGGVYIQFIFTGYGSLSLYHYGCKISWIGQN